MQNNGQPVRIADFKNVCAFKREDEYSEYSLEGLQKNMQTISYSETLSEQYQKIIGVDKTVVYILKEINDHRNKLHFFTDFKGAYRVDQHIEKWRFIKETSIAIFEKLKNY